jgi:toxin ParE1/3/4
MRRLKLVFTERSSADLSDARDWLVQNAGPRTAATVLTQIRGRFAHLKEWPYAGAQRPAYGEGVRSTPAGSYVIYYAVDRSAVTILRVLHGARDHDAIFAHPDAV